MMKHLLAGLALGWTVAVSGSAIGADALPASADPVLERRVMAIAEELRCLVCQNQTIADSHAELAVDLKNQVREMLLKGLSEREIKDYMVQRYGDFVLYRPPVKSNTWLLWLGPFVLLSGALVFLLLKLRKRNRNIVAADDGMSAEAQIRAERLLGIDSNSGAAPSADAASSGNKDKA